jgi:hypothetical protein
VSCAVDGYIARGESTLTLCCACSVLNVAEGCIKNNRVFHSMLQENFLFCRTEMSVIYCTLLLRHCDSKMKTGDVCIMYLLQKFLLVEHQLLLITC